MAALLSMRTGEIWAPGPRVLVWVPLSVVAGLFVGAAIHEHELSSASRWHLVILCAWLLAGLASLWVVLKASRTVYVSDAAIKRQRLVKWYLPAFIAPAAVLTYLTVLVLGAATLPAATDLWLGLTSPLVDAGHFVLPNVRTYSEQLTTLGLEARKPLLCHAYVVAFAIQMVAWTVMLSAPVAWWRAMPNKRLTLWEKGRKLFKMGAMFGLAFLMLFIFFGPEAGFDDLPASHGRGLDNFSHVSDLYLVMHPTIEAALASLSLFIVPLVFVVGLRWLALPSATSESAQWRLKDASVRTDSVWLGLCPKVDLAARPLVVESASRSRYFGWLLLCALPGIGIAAFSHAFGALWIISFVWPFMYSPMIWNWRAVLAWRKQIICRFDWRDVHVEIKGWMRTYRYDLPYEGCDCVLYYQKKTLTFWRKFKPIQVFQIVMLHSTKHGLLVPLYVAETEEPVREIAESYATTLNLPLHLHTCSGVRDASDIPADAELVGA